jgi:hypothetical protein
MQQLELSVRILKRKMRPSPAAIRMKVAAAKRLAMILGISFGAVIDAAGTKDLNWFKQRAELRAVSTRKIGE